MKAIATIGEILVEIMATERGDGFLEPVKLIGPFPSGAPAIFIDQAARFGQPAAMIGCVGDDDFGRVNLNRLRRDGVDVSGVRVDPEAVTGSAFVRYRADGSRAFVFNIKQSASGRITLDQAARAVLGRSDHLHIMGTALFSPRIVDIVLEAAELVKARGGTISFDPNLRPEMLNLAGLREACEELFRRCDLFLPSGPELTLFTTAKEEDAAVAEILEGGTGADRPQAGRRRRALFRCRRPPDPARLRGRGGRSDRRRRLFRRDLRQLLAARTAARRMLGLRRRERSAGGHQAGTDGGRREPGGARRLSVGAVLEAGAMSRPPPPLVSARLTDGEAGVTSVCTAHPAGHRSGAHAGGAQRTARPDRGDLQPGQPGGRLHRHDAGGLPRLRRGDCGAGRVRSLPHHPRGRSSRPQSLEAPARRTRPCGARRR